MLREEERNYLEKERPRYLEDGTPRIGKIRKRDSDIREKGQKAISYLKYLAENLTPDQHEQVFNEETFFPLIQSIFSENHPEWKTETKKSPISDERLFRLAVETSQFCLNKSVLLINPDLRRLVGGSSLRVFPEEQNLELVKTLFVYPKFLEKVKTE
jgi:hypothetical protein